MSRDAIIEIVRHFVPGAPIAEQSFTNFQTLRGALESIGRTEMALLEARGALERMRDLGVATDDDFTAFDVLRSNLYAAQFGWYTLVRNTLRSVDARADIPAPAMIPAVPRPSRVFRAKTPIRFAGFPARASAQAALPVAAAAGSAGGAVGTAGLGAVQVTWAAAVLAVLAALALVALYAYFVSSAVEEIARVLIVEKQTEQYKELLRARTDAYQVCLQGSEQQYADCTAAGGSPDICRATVINQCLDAAGVLIPTPGQAGLQPPETGSNPYKWVLVGAGGLFALIAGTLAYAHWRGLGRSADAPRRRSMGALPPRAFDLDGPSEYNLEVEES